MILATSSVTLLAASVVTPLIRGFHAGGKVRLDRYRDVGQVR